MFGRKVNTKTNRLTALFIIVFLVGILLYFINSNEKIGSLEYRVLGTVQSLLYLILIAAWCGLTRHRLIQRGLRKYISMTCLFLILWIVLRGLKYYFLSPETDAARYCWYAYYIPLMFYPACVLTAVLHIGKPDDWKLPRNKVLIFLIPAVIALIVLTNDLHQLIFFFPSDSITWSDFDYRRGILYALPFSWYSICVLLSLSVMIKRYRIPQIHRISTKIPLLPSVFGVIYDLQYVTGHALIFSDIIIVLCTLTVLTFESAIRVGYIRSNSHYLDTFRQSSVAARIYDKNGHLKYRSGSSDFHETDLPDQIFDQGSYIRDDIRYRFQRITDGYVVWQENISELLQIQKQLESANEYLQDKNLILRRQYETKIERRRLKEQNKLYDEMQNQTSGKLNKLEFLLKNFETAEGNEESETLLSIGLITAFLKRRNNLIFLARDNRRIPVSEIKNCIGETAKMLEVFGISCAVYNAAGGVVLFKHAVFLYDSLEEVIEATARWKTVYFISLSREQDILILRIRISGLDRIPEYLGPHVRVQAQEEGDYVLEIRTSRSN